MKIRVKIACLALLGLALWAYSFVWPNAPFTANDSSGYMRAAADLAAGCHDAPPFRAPFYPLLLVATNSTVEPTRALFYWSLLIHFSSVWLVLATVARYTDRASILVPIAVWMILPHNVQSSAQVLTETMCQLFLALLIFSILGWAHRQQSWYLWLAVFASVAAALTRPTYQMLPLLLIPTVFVITKRFRPIAIVALTSMLVLGAYAGYNQRRFGFFGITWSLGANLCNRTLYFLEELPPSPLRDVMIAARNDDLIRGNSHTALQFQWKAWSSMKSAAGAHSDIELASTLGSLNRQLILRKPVNYISSVASALAKSWLPYTTNHSIFGFRVLQAIWSAVHFVVIACFFASIWVIGGSSIFAAASRLRSLNPLRDVELRLAFWLSALLPLYTVLISSMFDVGDPRQRVPSDFCFAIHLGVTVTVILTWWKRTAAKQESFMAVASR